MTTVNANIAMRLGTTSQWAAATVPLLQGEWGMEITESDEHIFKVGDGESLWADLPAFTGQPGEPGREVSLQATDTHIQWRLGDDSEWQDLVALEDLKGEPAEGSEPVGEREFLTPQVVLVNEDSLTNENLVMAPEGYTFAIIDSDTVADGLYEADGSDTLVLVKEIGELGDMIFPDGVFDTFDDLFANTPKPRAIFYYAPHYLDTNWARIDLDADLSTTAGWDTGPLASEFSVGGVHQLRDVIQRMGEIIADLDSRFPAV